MIKLNDYIRLNNGKTVTVIAYDEVEAAQVPEAFSMPWKTDDDFYRTNAGIALCGGIENQPEGMSEAEFDKAHEGI